MHFQIKKYFLYYLYFKYFFYYSIISGHSGCSKWLFEVISLVLFTLLSSSTTIIAILISISGIGI